MVVIQRAINSATANGAVEVFEANYRQIKNEDRVIEIILDGSSVLVGWFYWFKIPGCREPYSDTFGPFPTEAEALSNARGKSDENIL